MKLFLVFMVSLLTWSSCRFNTSSINASDNISAELKAEMRALDARFIEAIASEDMNEIKKFLSDSLIAISDPQALEDFFLGLAQPIKLTKLNSREQFDVNNAINKASTSLLLLGEDAKIEFIAENKHSFISLLITDKELGGDKRMFFIVYGQYPEGWKVNIVNSNLYSFAGLTARDFFAKANEAYKKGSLIDAGLYISKCEVLKKPVQKWVYDQDKQMSALIEQISADIEKEYTFPFPVDISSKPVIIGVQIASDSLGLVPFIQYETQLEIRDDAKMTQENDELHSKIGQIFKGMDLHERIFYRAYEKGNDEGSYGFLKKKGEN